MKTKYWVLRQTDFRGTLVRLVIGENREDLMKAKRDYTISGETQVVTCKSYSDEEVKLLEECLGEKMFEIV